MSKTIESGVGLTNAWLAAPGVLSMKTLWAELAHLRPTAVCGPARTVVWGGCRQRASLPDSSFVLACKPYDSTYHKTRTSKTKSTEANPQYRILRYGISPKSRYAVIEKAIIQHVTVNGTTTPKNTFSFRNPSPILFRLRSGTNCCIDTNAIGRQTIGVHHMPWQCDVVKRSLPSDWIVLLA